MAFHLTPVVERIAEHMKGSGKLFADETTLPVLNPGAGKTRTGFLWVMARDDRPWGGTAPPAVVFTYAPGRGGIGEDDCRSMATRATTASQMAGVPRARP